jgi:hypothetical protein
MSTTNKTAVELVHRLLFRALIEIRAQGHEHKNKLIFHLADLFHTTALDLEAAAAGQSTYEDVLRQLEKKAREKKCERWLQAALAQLETATPPTEEA